MNKEQIQERLNMEKEIQNQFNIQENLSVRTLDLHVSRNSHHEFDIFEVEKVIGGISTSPWKNSTGSNNSGGQDRVAAELLWLTLWPGKERRVIILTSRDMAERLLQRWSGCYFPHPIEIFHYDSMTKKLKVIGILHDRNK